MKYAIIAAGEGSRLAKDGVSLPKPLVKVNGVPIIDRLIRIFMNNNATGIYVICNEINPAVQSHLAEIQENGIDGKKVPLHYIVKSTPSSMHSFYELRHFLQDEPFILTTVDTIFDEKAFKSYIYTLQNVYMSGTADGVMGITDFIDDEAPLYVGMDEEDVITGFYDDAHHCQYISGGIYGLTPSSIDTLERCVSRGESRMRNFQRALVVDGKRLLGYRFTKVLDIDHAADIQKAEAFINNGCV